MTVTDTIATETEKTKRTFASVPLKPLWDAALRRAGNSAARNGFAAVEFADLVGFNVKAVNRWQASGTIPWVSADEAASNLGVAAYFVWYDDWLNLKGDYEDIASGEVDDLIKKDWQALEDDLVEVIEYNGFGYGKDQILAEVERWMQGFVPRAYEKMAAYLNSFSPPAG
jgi:transcriptional regulator with XRE-family HTH domain